MSERSSAVLVEGNAEAAALRKIRRWRSQLAPLQHATISPLPLDEVPGWATGPTEPAFRHVSGRFFSIVGRHIETPDRGRTWTQPMVDQPEVGLLGLAVTPSSRGYSALVQAKAEPGNVNGVQLSPTVQATASNQLQVHNGSAVPYLDLFTASSNLVLVDSRQSEHGDVFWRKRNRAMMVLTPPLDPRPGFRWIELADLLALLQDNDLVHADTRAVLACAPWALPGGYAGDDFQLALGRSLAAGCSTETLRPLTRWLSAERTARTMESRQTSLPELLGWERTQDSLSRLDGQGFEVVAVEVEAAGREVDRWCQPMIRPRGVGLIGLAVTRRGGEVEVLMQARPEAGLVDGAELGPTVQVAGGDMPMPGPERDLSDLIVEQPASAVIFDSILSDEGGRFLHARHRHLVVEVADLAAPPGFRWCRLGELIALLIHSHQVNMQARSALVCLLSISSGKIRPTDHQQTRQRS